MELTVEALLNRLKKKPAVELLETYDQQEYTDLWEKDEKGPRLYRAFSNKLVHDSFLSLGLSLARRGLETFKDDVELRYNIALAYARSGNILSAEQFVEPLLRIVEAVPGRAEKIPAQLGMDIVALRGRLFKDRYQRETSPAEKRKLAARSADWYERAMKFVKDDPYPVINAATMHYMAGALDLARSQAAAARDQALRRGELPEAADDYWMMAIRGEASVILDDQEHALAGYRAAAEAAFAKGKIGDVVSMLANLRLLAEAGATADPQWLQERLGSVVVFSGHMIDSPRRTASEPPRFPNDPRLVIDVKAAIKQRLEKVNARFGFTSLAAGSDILFAEVMLERGAELHVILPFAKEDFLLTSVDHGHVDDPRWKRWRNDFESILGKLKPDHLHYATEEAYLGTDLLFGHANTFLQGLAVVRARQCLIDPVAVAVLDPTAKPISGGTRDFLDGWKKSGLKAEVIDLAELRGDDLPTPRLTPYSPANRPTPAEMPRDVRAMLFADVAGFSKMNEVLAPTFFRRFPHAIASVINGAGSDVLLANTWGDGFFAVFESVEKCAGFALELLKSVGDNVDWAGMGFPDINPLRVGLHAGPVFELSDDPILRHRNYFGQHVNRAARIEPVTMPGCAFASEQFAALLARQAADAFRTELIGVEKLPKKSGIVALYRISRT